MVFMRIKDFYLCSYYMQFLNHGKKVKGNIHNLIIQDHQIIRKHHMYFVNRLSSKKIYNFLIAQN